MLVLTSRSEEERPAVTGRIKIAAKSFRCLIAGDALAEAASSRSLAHVADLGFRFPKPSMPRRFAHTSSAASHAQTRSAAKRARAKRIRFPCV